MSYFKIHQNAFSKVLGMDELGELTELPINHNHNWTDERDRDIIWEDTGKGVEENRGNTIQRGDRNI